MKSSSKVSAVIKDLDQGWSMYWPAGRKWPASPFFYDLWENITISDSNVITPVCCFATFLARADPRGSCTIPSVVGKRLQLITHTSLVQVTLFSSTSALVNNLVGSRATVGHSSSLLSQRKSRRICFWFSLFLSAFQTVFFKTPCLVPSNYSLCQDYLFNSIEFPQDFPFYFYF